MSRLQVAQLRKGKKGKKQEAEANQPEAGSEQDFNEAAESVNESSQPGSTEPMPDAPLDMPEASGAPDSLEQQEQEQPTQPEAIEADATNESKNDTTPQTQESKQSLSQQSKLRSSSFRRSSPHRDSTSDSTKKGSLDIVSESQSPPDVFRRQALRLEELERENKRLEKDLGNARSKWNQADEELEELRAMKAEVESLRTQLVRADEITKETETLKEEIAVLRRQNLQAAKRNNTTHPSSSHQPDPAIPANVSTSPSPSADSAALQNELKAKASNIEAMEIEISNLRARLDSQTETSNANIRRLEDKISVTEAALNTTTQNLENTKSAADSTTKTSNEAQVKGLEAQLSEASTTKAEFEKKVSLLDAKISTLTNVHKESESRHQVLLQEKERLDEEQHQLKQRAIESENEYLRLREEVEHLRERNVDGVSATDNGGHDDELLDQLEDEDRSRLQKRIRELEDEIFDVRRNLWREKRIDLQEGMTDPSVMESVDYSQDDDDANIQGGTPLERRKNVSRQSPRKHSSFSTVLSSGIAAFTGTPLHQVRGQAHPEQEEEDVDDDFDENAFANAQREAEERNRIERMREVKRKLRDEWKGYRLDLVDARLGAQGAGIPLGDIFEA